MAVIETKFSVGDVVYYAGTTTTSKQHPCPDCKGDRKWSVKSPAGGEYEVGCPRCTARYLSDRDLSLAYTAHVPTAQRLTIGSVQFNSASGSYNSGARYMCRETGVGSGNVYDENRLFETEEQALHVAQIMAAKANAETDWIVSLYSKTLEISDYQIEHAVMKNAVAFRSKVGSLFWNVSDLFETIEKADDKDAILEAVDDYKRYTWERDKASFSAQGIEAATAGETERLDPKDESAVATSDAPALPTTGDET